MIPVDLITNEFKIGNGQDKNEMISFAVILLAGSTSNNLGNKSNNFGHSARLKVRRWSLSLLRASDLKCFCFCRMEAIDLGF